MEYNYTFIKGSEYITVTGTGTDPYDLKDITWTSSLGAEGVLKQMDSISSVYTPTIGFVSVDNYKNDIYVQIAKFGSIYKNGWRFGETNLSSIELAGDVTKDETLAKGKTKKRVYVKGTGKRVAHWRMQEVGREEIDPKKIENIWDIPLDQFVRLVSGDKQLLKERYIDDHRYNEYEMHPTLKDLLDLCTDDIKYNNEANLRFFDDPDINVHIKSIYQEMGGLQRVPLYVLKDYPDIAAEYGITDFSDEAIADEERRSNYSQMNDLFTMPKAEYDSIIDGIKVAYDTDPKHITDKMLNQEYEEELADCKRSAKLRKRLFDKLSKHMQYGFTPDTMDARLHKSLVEMAHKYNIEIPAATKAGYPTLYTDVPFTYEMTGNEECDNVANDILTQIRDKLGTDVDEWYNHVKLSHVIHSIIGATGESVPMMYGAGIDDGPDRISAAVLTGAVSSALIGPDLMDRINNFKNPTGRSKVMMTFEDGIRSYQSSGVIHLGERDVETLAHEYGHAIDWMLPEINELSQAFVNRRTDDEPLVSLADVVPYGHYDDDELTKPDNFMDPYIGKWYDHSSSEVLSMGMGYMTSSESMMDMYEQDPEYLGYILAVLSGRAHGAEVTHGPMSGSDEPGEFAPANKSETIEIDLYKLLDTTGLTRKRVLVRRKNEAPFWSTRWVQQGDTVKDTVEAAGFELVAVEGEEPDPVSLKDLIDSAYDAGKAAYADGLPNRSGSDVKLKEIVKLNPGGVKDEIAIHEGWVNGWNATNIAASTIDPDDIARAKARDEAEMDISWDIINPAYEAGKAAFKRDIKSSGADFGLIPILKEGNGTEATSKMVNKAWQRGWDEEAKKAPEPTPKTVDIGTLLYNAEAAGRSAFLRGDDRGSAMYDEELATVVRFGDGRPETYSRLSRTWLMGWDAESDKKFKDEDNFDTMPDVDPDTIEVTSESRRGSQKDRPIYARDIPLSDRISGSVRVPGVGEIPAITVDDIQIGDRLHFEEGVVTVKTARSSKGRRVGLAGKSVLLTFEEMDDKGENLALKMQKRSMVGVIVDEGTTVKIPESEPKPTLKPEPKVIYTGGDFTPAKSLPEAITRLDNQFISIGPELSYVGHGVNLDGLKLDAVNSILRGFEATLGRYNIKMDYIGWNKKKSSCVGLYQKFGDHSTISFQKTATKNVKRDQKKTITNFGSKKVRDLEKWNRYLEMKEAYKGSHIDLHERIEHLEACDRWTVNSVSDDPLAVTSAHEAHHAIFYKYDLKGLWKQNIKLYVGDKMSKDVKCASVSEYGMSNMSELFAEVGAAVTFGIEIDDHVKQAYLDTMESVK